LNTLVKIRRQEKKTKTKVMDMQTSKKYNIPYHYVAWEIIMKN